MSIIALLPSNDKVHKLLFNVWSEDKSRKKREESDEEIKEKRQEGAINNIASADIHPLNKPKASQKKPWLSSSEQASIKYIKASHEESCKNQDTMTQTHTQNIKQQQHKAVEQLAEAWSYKSCGCFNTSL